MNNLARMKKMTNPQGGKKTTEKALFSNYWGGDEQSLLWSIWLQSGFFGWETLHQLMFWAGEWQKLFDKITKVIEFLGELNDLSSIESDQIGGGKKKKNKLGRGVRNAYLLRIHGKKPERLHPVFHSFILQNIYKPNRDWKKDALVCPENPMGKADTQLPVTLVGFPTSLLSNLMLLVSSAQWAGSD